MTARSIIGRYACLMHLAEGNILLAIRSHFDSSGKLEDRYITLAAMAGSDDIWADFEDKWRDLLHRNEPRADYIHMRQLTKGLAPFDWRHGWNIQRAFALINKCLMYLQTLDKKRFRMFYCTVDLEARKRLVGETYPIPSPIELCNEYCTKNVLGWFLTKYPGLLTPSMDTAHFFFDRHEYFKQPFEDRWNAETAKPMKPGNPSLWAIIKQVGSVDMRDVPGIQAADILAWAANREKTVEGDAPGKHLAYLMKQVIPSSSIVWDEAKMREQYRPLIHLP